MSESDMTAVSPRVVIGPSGAGKSTLATAFARDHPEYELVRTHTTRPPRPGEGDTHIFVGDEVFSETDYLGTLSVFGARYGLPPFSARRTALVLLRLAALERFTALYPRAKIIQVEAPLRVLTERLRQRGDPDRADRSILEREVRQGRKVAHGIVRTDRPFERVLAEFTKLIKDD